MAERGGGELSVSPIVCYRDRKGIIQAVWWFILMLAAAESSRGGAAELRTPGLLFEPAGQLTVATGKWTLVIRLQDQEVRKQEGRIREQIDGITEALSDSRKQIPRSDGEGGEEEELRQMRRFYTSAERAWTQERRWMLRELDMAGEKVTGTLKEGRRVRKVRGLIPFIGAGLSYLFGTATEEETTNLHKEIRGVQVEAGELRHVQELQATLVGRLAKEERQGRKDLHALANRTNEIITVMAKTRDRSRAVHRHLRQEIEVTRAVGVAARTAGAAVMTFRQETETLTRAMAHAQEGRLTAAIISPRALARAMAAVQAQLPHGWAVAVPESTGAQLGYHGLSVSAVPLSGGYEVHVRVPLRQLGGSRFDLYRVTALPEWLSNRTVGVVTEAGADWFAITPDQRLHLGLSNEDMAQCHRKSKWTTCEDLPHAIREDRDGCLYQAFRRNDEAAKKTCRRRLTTLRGQLKRVGGRHWAYAFPEKETFTLQCAGKASGGAVHLLGSGVFEVPSGCAAMGDRLVIPARLDGGRTTVSEPRLDNFTVFDTTTNLREVLRGVSAVGTEGDDLAGIPLLDIADGLPDEAIVDSTIAQVKTALREDYRPPASEDGVGGWALAAREHGPLTVSTVVLVALAAVAVRRCVRRRSGAYREDPRPGPSSSERQAATDTRMEAMTEMLIRVAKLEERVEGQAKEIETLKRFM